MREIGVKFLMVLLILVLPAGCSSFSAISDDELEKIAADYFSFYYSVKDLKMAILERGTYQKGCDCYPVKFIMARPRQSSTKRTLYFYKTDSGAIEVREFANGIKFVAK